MAPSRNATWGKSFVRKPGGANSGVGRDTSIPIRTEAPPPLRQPTRMQRSKTLTRPERQHPQVPLINPQSSSAASTSEPGSPTWRIFSKVLTFWALSPCLSACGMRDKATQQAWREKVTLVSLALTLGGIVGFVTIALNKVLCPSTATASTRSFASIGSGSGTLGIDGWNFDISAAKLPDSAQVGVDLWTMADTVSGYDVTTLFNRTVKNDYPACQNQTGAYATSTTCDMSTATLTKCALGYLNTTNLATLGMTNLTRRVGYGWEDLKNSTFANYLVIEGHVLNMNPYLLANPKAIANDSVDLAIRSQLQNFTDSGARDATRYFYTSSATKNAIPCMMEKYMAGSIDKITPGCFVSDMFLYVSLLAILGVVMIRFFMALYFSWFLADRMSSAPRDDGQKKVPLNVLPQDAATAVNASGAAPWAGRDRGVAAFNKQLTPIAKRAWSDAASSSPSVNTVLTAETIGIEPWIISLVTCYSENEEGIGTTLTSLADSDYPDHKKLLFVVADGMVTGHGESQSTPDTCVGLLDADTRFGTPMPMSFVAVAQGAKAHNMAMVYAGHYARASGGRRVPMVVIVKCGTPEEAGEGKPGNRGKRDSQMILMNFLQRVTYNDRMTPLDFDLFRKIQALMGVTPDFFELVLMVDADTKVYPAGMRKLSNAMMRDHMVMGACGETRISNKTASWVTAIQVYEYFISHHLVKAFESVFGGVTCLPGCFSMYRIKARKPSDDDWVPILVKPEITREYSQSTVSTLHQKNLLLLGEDRFLTTTLLRTFPNRKMIFVPQARCRTEVPHTFKMLLSQRRRWINSTIHNLMELVLVRDLCGTFCFSMQFVIFMDLVGTLVLPVAICLTYTLIVSYCLNPPKNFSEAIPLMLLIAVIGLPAFLILLATRKVVYVMWMGIYLVFLPVWNFILPTYAFWHFDDFSWGETRKVAGEGKGEGGHGGGEGDSVFAAASVPLRKWEDWERSRQNRQKRAEKRRREMEAQFGGKFWNDQQDLRSQGSHSPDGDYTGAPRTRHPHFRESDTWSETTEEDVWGAHVGVYEEAAPPPTQVIRHTMIIDGDGTADVLAAGELEAMLEKEEFVAGEAGAGAAPQGQWKPGGDRLQPVPRTLSLRSQPLAPSRAQARRSQRQSKNPRPPMPNGLGGDPGYRAPGANGATFIPAGGGGGVNARAPPYRNGSSPAPGSYDPLRHPNGRSSPAAVMGYGMNASTTNFEASREDVSLLRGNISPQPPSIGGPVGNGGGGGGGGGYQLHDLGPGPAVATGASRTRMMHGAPVGADGQQQQHARQRSSGGGHVGFATGSGPPGGGGAAGGGPGRGGNRSAFGRRL
ncbi:hypothetical protein BCV69DRAFT_267874 [Microstroma glucosiphilum]|uniref:chitin synthase n=1 Tax=Pseudomicrostroma glucosiphilum TaxID=1684307 RepID=A0A316UH22_9BASI|nr:hypothetical protein BCV69DRAFT_267874 [Pseudomicrostroma glucosiphilum]PWN22475.1 hypothetical protein BCV69DRAFT_267874 [Pseudomicrostroma glucosiphilum]